VFLVVLCTVPVIIAVVALVTVIVTAAPACKIEPEKGARQLPG
jgi:hypothetical protein